MKTNWTEETIKSAIYSLMEKLDIKRMPNSVEMRENRMTGLSRAIGLSGGMYHWSEKLGLETKAKKSLWDDERIEREIRACMGIFCIERMPTASEFKEIGRNDLHCAISKSPLKYSGWAKKLGIEMKSSETTKGNEYEHLVKKEIESISNHLTVEKMTTKHPYDLLINGCVKVDVKVSAPHNFFGPRAHTFRTAKKHATCDIYICVALNEKGNVENFFIIPAAHASVTTLNICGESKYNKYIDRWDFVYQFVNAYERAINL